MFDKFSFFFFLTFAHLKFAQGRRRFDLSRLRRRRVDARSAGRSLPKRSRRLFRQCRRLHNGRRLSLAQPTCARRVVRSNIRIRPQAKPRDGPAENFTLHIGTKRVR